jgi:hypothetical protein
MTPLGWLIWGFASVALIAGAFWIASVLNRARIRPKDLTDDQNCSDWSHYCGDCAATDGKHRPHCPAWRQ